MAAAWEDFYSSRAGIIRLIKTELLTHLKRLHQSDLERAAARFDQGCDGPRRSSPAKLKAYRCCGALAAAANSANLHKSD